MPRGGAHNKKPTQLKVLRGTARPDRIKANEPKPKPVAPESPAWLDALARKAWERYAPMLERLGLLTEADGDLLGAYCQALSRYVAAVKRLRKVEKLVKNAEDPLAANEAIRKAEVSVEKAEHALRLLANEFGLTPAARGRLNVPEGDAGDETILDQLWGAQS